VFYYNGLAARVQGNWQFVVNKKELIFIKVASDNHLQGVKIGDIIGKLHIFEGKSLIFSENLYSIITVK
jgi:hypothetical protein